MKINPIALIPLLALPFIAPEASAQLQPAATQIVLSHWVPIECSYVGNNEFAGFWAKNTTASTIPKGTYVRYTYDDKTPSTQLSNDLEPGKSTRISTTTFLSSNTTCKATFNAGDPDIIVKGLRWTSPTTATADLQNMNPWIPTTAFAVRVGSHNCVSVPVQSADSPSLTLGKGELKTVTVTIAKAGATYLKATADFENKVHEANETNNVGFSSEFQTCQAR